MGMEVLDASHAGSRIRNDLDIYVSEAGCPPMSLDMCCGASTKQLNLQLVPPWECPEGHRQSNSMKRFRSVGVRGKKSTTTRTDQLRILSTLVRTYNLSLWTQHV